MVVDDMGEGIGGRGLGGGKEARSGCGWFMRNSGVSSSRVEVSSVCVRASAVCCWSTVVSSSSLLEEKKSEGWFRGVLGKDSGCEGSRQLALFEEEMVAVREGMMPVGKARSFVMLGPG